jgi:HEPN domain-containing protein
MRADEKVLEVVREWARKADNDLRNASYTLTMPKDCPTDTVCFHAQQCVEKYLKAMLTLLEIDYHQTHSVDMLLMLIPSEKRPMLSTEEQDRLTEYATVTRYPGDYDPIPLTEAEQAVSIAHRVRDDTRSMLPANALPQKAQDII